MQGILESLQSTCCLNARLIQQISNSVHVPQSGCCLPASLQELPFYPDTHRNWSSAEGPYTWAGRPLEREPRL